jgi:hypothetical protein
MTLGLYGTAVWIDSHTEDYFGHGDHGQRLAGRILMAVGSRSDNDDADADPFAPIKSSHDQMASIVFCVGEHNDWIRLAVDEEEGRLAIGGVTGSITILDYA